MAVGWRGTKFQNAAALSEAVKGAIKLSVATTATSKQSKANKLRTTDMQGRAALSLLRGASRTQLTRPALSQIRPAVANFATVNEFDSHDHNYDE